MTAHIRTLILFTISGFFLWLAVKEADINAVWQAFSEFSKLGVLLATLVWLGGYTLRALRWQIFLNAIDHVHWLNSFRVLVVGFMSNALLPLRAGEFIRAYFLNQINPRIPKSTAFATVAGERVFDGLIVVGITLIGATGLVVPEWASSVIRFSTILFVVCFVVFIFLARYTQITRRIFVRVSRFLPTRLSSFSDNLFDKFIDGLSTLKSWKDIVYLLTFSIVIWSVEVVFMYLCALSFGINISIFQVAFLTGMLNLGVMIPAAPGGLGTIEFINVAILGLYGVSNELALSYALVTHAATTISIVGLGLSLLSQMGLSLPGMLKKATQTAPTNISSS